jgi:DNA polymerase elongation subunit (family B)
MNVCAYDIEVYPNFFSVTFTDIFSDQTKSFVQINNDSNLKELREFLKDITVLIGYNNLDYDDRVLNYVLKGKTNEEIFEFSNLIIKDDKKTHIRLPFTTIDLFKILHHDRMGISLKQCAINMQWPKIQDLPIHYKSIIKEDQVQSILEYNLNDVLITKELYFRITDEINLRIKVGELYNVNLLNKSRTGIGDKIMEKLYSSYTGLDVTEFKFNNTKREIIKFSDCISDKIKFQTPQLINLLKELKEFEINVEGDSDFKTEVLIDGLIHTMAKGGLHSANKPDIIEPKDNEVIIDADVGSFYPAIMVEEKVKPKHLDNNFCDIVKLIMDERLLAKRNKEKIKAEALKIAINSIYGKMGNDYSFLLDKQALYSVTLNGELYLLMLIESLHIAGIKCVYSNTDGITCQLDQSLVQTYYDICEEWQNYTGFILEFTNYKKMILKDVNNYLIINTDGSTKLKGDFSNKIELSKGYDAPIVAKAVYAYFVDGIPVKQFLTNHDNIYDFCIAQKTGPQFITEYHTIDNFEHNIQILQKNNRYYVSTKGGYLYKKYKDRDERTSLVAGFKTKLFNDYFESDDYQIDYGYYSKRVNDIINKVQNNNQLKLF